MDLNVFRRSRPLREIVAQQMQCNMRQNECVSHMSNTLREKFVNIRIFRDESRRAI